MTPTRQAAAVAFLVLLATAAYGDDAETLREEATDALAAEDYDKAIRLYTKAIQLEPKNAEGYAGRAAAHVGKEDFDKALADCDQAIRLEPNESDHYILRGSVRTLKKDYDKAVADYDKAIQLDPASGSAHLERGRVLVLQKQYDRALKDFDKAMELEPDGAELYVARGDLYARKKEFARAVKDFEKAIELEPASSEGYNALAWLLATCRDDKTRDGKKAVDLARKGLELSENDPYIQDTLAAAHAELGQFEEAVKLQQQAVAAKKFPKDELEKAKKRLELYQQKKPYRDEDY